MILIVIKMKKNIQALLSKYLWMKPWMFFDNLTFSFLGLLKWNLRLESAKKSCCYLVLEFGKLLHFMHSLRLFLLLLWLFWIEAIWENALSSSFKMNWTFIIPPGDTFAKFWLHKLFFFFKTLINVWFTVASHKMMQICTNSWWACSSSSS